MIRMLLVLSSAQLSTVNSKMELKVQVAAT